MDHENIAKVLDAGATKFSSAAGWKEVMPRKAVEPAPSAATTGSARYSLNLTPQRFFLLPCWLLNEGRS